jgi:hypothetical protein
MTNTQIIARLKANQLGHARFAAALDGVYGPEVQAEAKKAYAVRTPSHKAKIRAAHKRRAAAPKATVRRASQPRSTATQAGRQAAAIATAQGLDAREAAKRATRMAKARPSANPRTVALAAVASL